MVMKDSAHTDVILGASNALAGCALILLLTIYAWLGLGLFQTITIELPTAIRAASYVRF